MSKKGLQIAVLWVIIGWFSQIAGGETLMLDEIVIKGQSESTWEESLTIREVRESPARDIGEALKQVEGIDIVRKGAIANDVVLRGFQGDDINVLLDGVRLYGGCPNRMDSPAFHFDFAEVEQIKIIKGPYDLSNAGSLGGLVYAVTKKPSKGVGADLNLTYGSYDLVNASAALSYGSDRYDGLVGYAYKYSSVPESGNGKLLTDIYPETSPNRYRSETIDSRAYDINTVWVKAGFAPGANSRSDLNYSYQDAGHILYPYLLMDAEYDRTHRVNWTYSIKAPSPRVEQVDLQAYWNEVDHLMHDEFRESSRTSPRGFAMQTDALSRVYGAKLAGSFAAGPGLLSGGLDYYRRNWDATNLLARFDFASQPMIPDVEVDNYGAFGEYELPLGKRFVLKGGVRGDLSRVDANKLDADRLAFLYQPYFPGTSLDTSADFEELSGNLQLTWTPISGLELFAGLGSSVRIPDPQELYIGLQRPMRSNRVGNPELAPTRNNQADIGAKYATERFYVNASLFYSDLDDYINIVDLPDPDGPGMGTLLPARSFENIDARMWGGELGSQLSLPWDLFLRASLSYTEGKNRDADRPLAEIPPLKGSMALRYDVDTYFFEIAEQFAARQDRVDSALNEEETAGWAITDLKGGLNYKALSVYAGVNNLFDKQYTTHLAFLRDPFSSGVKVPEPGRNFYITASCSF